MVRTLAILQLADRNSFAEARGIVSRLPADPKLRSAALGNLLWEMESPPGENDFPEFHNLVYPMVKSLPVEHRVFPLIALVQNVPLHSRIPGRTTEIFNILLDDFREIPPEIAMRPVQTAALEGEVNTYPLVVFGAVLPAVDRGDALLRTWDRLYKASKRSKCEMQQNITSAHLAAMAPALPLINIASRLQDTLKFLLHIPTTFPKKSFYFKFTAEIRSAAILEEVITAARSLCLSDQQLLFNMIAPTIYSRPSKPELEKMQPMLHRERARIASEVDALTDNLEEKTLTKRARMDYQPINHFHEQLRMDESIENITRFAFGHTTDLNLDNPEIAALFQGLLSSSLSTSSQGGPSKLTEWD